MLQDFTFLRKLGEGSFGTVYLVRRISDGQLYALKKVKILGMNSKDKQNALNEIRLLASVHNMNVVSYKESFLDVQSQTLCLVMEYAEKGDALKRIEGHYKKHTSFAEYELWSATIQCLCGLKALHDLKVMHRDVKCANILISGRNEYKLADFNVSKVVNQKNGLLYTQTGTPYYASPEVWKDKPYDFKSDIWSLGCALYEMAALRPPFKAKDMKGLYQKVTAGNYPPISSRYSYEFREVISLMLQPCTDFRPTVDQLLSLPIVQQRIQELAQFDQNVEACCSGLLADFQEELLSVPSSVLTANQNLDGCQSGSLINTIKMPRVLRQLADRLPKPNYESSLQRRRILSDPVTPNKRTLAQSRQAVGLQIVTPSEAIKSSLKTENATPKTNTPHRRNPSLKRVQNVGITPQMNSTKFAALEMMGQGSRGEQMRPTSSKVGKFISGSDKPQSLDNVRLHGGDVAHQYQHRPKAHLPQNLQKIDSRGCLVSVSQEPSKPPLSHRKQSNNDEILPLAMLNPPIDLYDYQEGLANDVSSYPDFIRDNEVMMHKVNQVISHQSPNKFANQLGNKRNRVLQQQYPSYNQSPKQDKENLFPHVPSNLASPRPRRDTAFEMISVNLIGNSEKSQPSKFVTKKQISRLNRGERTPMARISPLKKSNDRNNSNLAHPRQQESGVYTVEDKTPLQSKLQGHMYRRQGSQDGDSDFNSNQKMVRDSVDQVKLLVGDVERKIQKMQRESSQGSHSSRNVTSRSIEVVTIVKPNKLSRVVSSIDTTTTSDRQSIQFNSGEVKKALYKVSSSVDIDSLQKPVSRQVIDQTRRSISKPRDSNGVLSFETP